MTVVLLSDGDYAKAEEALNGAPGTITRFSFRNEEMILYRRPDGDMYVRGDDRVEKKIVKGDQLGHVARDCTPMTGRGILIL